MLREEHGQRKPGCVVQPRKTCAPQRSGYAGAPTATLRPSLLHRWTGFCTRSREKADTHIRPPGVFASDMPRMSPFVGAVALVAVAHLNQTAVGCSRGCSRPGLFWPDQVRSAGERVPANLPARRVGDSRGVLPVLRLIPWSHRPTGRARPKVVDRSVQARREPLDGRSRSPSDSAPIGHQTLLSGRQSSSPTNPSP